MPVNYQSIVDRKPKILAILGADAKLINLGSGEHTSPQSTLKPDVSDLD